MDSETRGKLQPTSFVMYSASTIQKRRKTQWNLTILPLRRGRHGSHLWRAGRAEHSEITLLGLSDVVAMAAICGELAEPNTVKSHYFASHQIECDSVQVELCQMEFFSA